ncbi:MAG: hypothetical protein ACLR8L_00055 [Oscillospiraceae bacterium]
MADGRGNGGQFASLKAYLGTTEYTLTSGTQLVQDVTAGEDGKITIQVKADWSNTVTAAGGKFTITAFTAVDKAASMLPGCTALTDGNLTRWSQRRHRSPRRRRGANSMASRRRAFEAAGAG